MEVEAMAKLKEEVLSKIKPKANCKRCFGRGNIGINVKTNALVICSCYRDPYNKALVAAGVKGRYPFEIPMDTLRSKADSMKVASDQVLDSSNVESSVTDVVPLEQPKEPIIVSEQIPSVPGVTEVVPVEQSVTAVVPLEQSVTAVVPLEQSVTAVVSSEK